MRFGLLRRLSHLIHRRTRSDSAITVPVVAADIPASSSWSYTRRPDSNILDSVLPPAPTLSPILFCDTPLTGLHVTESLPDPASRSSPLTCPGGIQTTGKDIAPQVPVARRTAELSSVNSRLRVSIETLKTDITIAEEAIRGVKTDLEEKRSQVAAQKRRSADLALQVQLRKQEAEQCEQLYEAVSSAGLIDLAHAHAASSAPPEDFQDAAVDAIQDAADSPSSIWSKIVGLVVGPRAPDNYVSAIKMTLQARREARHMKNVVNFWKKMAQRNERSADIVTPSSSNLSQVREPLSDERKKAVEELRERRRAAARMNQGTLSQSTSTGSAISSNASASLPYRLPDSHPSIASVLSSMSTTTSSNLDFQDHNNQSFHRASALEPLASDSFKQELIACHSSERLFSSTSYKLFRPSSPPSSGSESKEKKRKDAEGSNSVVVSESKTSIHSGEISLSSSALLSGSAPVKVDRHDLRPEPSSSHLWIAPNPDPSTSSSSFISAERALESFERICTRFSSGSSTFGSLHTINEESFSFAGSSRGPRTLVGGPPSSSMSGSSSRSSGYLSAVDASLVSAEGSGGQVAVGEPPSSSESCSISHSSSYLSAMADATLVDAERAGVAGVGTFAHAARTNAEAFTTSQSEKTASSDQGKSFCGSVEMRVESDTLIELELASAAKMGGILQISKQAQQMNAMSSQSTSSISKKSKLPIFRRIPSLSKPSLISDSSSKQSISSSRTSTTIPAMESKENMPPPPPSSRKVGFKPVLPLRIIKKNKQ